ncbi:HU-CCDC81 and SPOR domain-containing protein [Streptomyces sp. CdTB01]|uniref:SMODS-associated NUDIX domain-containing protein n=1 Tax=Streptomyces sp. CdTB01 TaxID=1725411 RepID=UPI00073ACFE7|nr:HU-CCDC81 and SPOR domain-containing protein [Streptomyces sp. CdTB01]ALV30666.1 hypothetical protein AS200_00030 [Streptomyces sp. CdTB01]
MLPTNASSISVGIRLWPGGRTRTRGWGMLVEIAVGAVVSFLGWISMQVWLHRRHMKLLVSCWLRPRKRVRVSVSVLLRLQDDDCYVLFASVRRPGSYGPPGGVAKYRPSATSALRRLGFQEESRQRPDMRHDLRGFIPGWSLAGFARWWNTAEQRENFGECLSRELAEELAEVGYPGLAGSHVGGMAFLLMHTVIDGPRSAPGRPYRQIRFFEICELDPAVAGTHLLRQALLDVAADTSEQRVILASGEDIEYGRHQAGYIQPQSAFLLGTHRLHADLPPLRMQ